MNNSIAAIILTYNEEKHISRCINSLKNICEEIFVIDSFSKDRTVEIAKELGAQVYQNPWKNYATQFNWGLKNCPITTEWIWRIDADEFLEGNLGVAMKNTLAKCNNEVNGIYVRKRIDFMGKPLLHGGWYPSYHLKVWRRGHGECENRWMDEHIRIFDGTTITIEEGNQVDANLNDLTWWTEKHNGYATREMADMLMMEYRLDDRDKEVQAKFWGTEEQRKRWLKMKYIKTPLFLRPFINFNIRYILKGGFLDGKEGFIWHFLQGFWYRFLVDAKIYEIKKRFGWDDSKKIYAYSWDEDFSKKLNVVLDKFPEYKDYVEFVTLGLGGTSDDYKTAIDTALTSGDKYPTLIPADNDVAKYWSEDDSKTANLYDLGFTDEMLANSYDFAKQYGTTDGELKCVTWQATAGSVYYRRDIAKKVLGTDDPAKVQEALASWDKFFETAETLKAAGYKIVSGAPDVKYAIWDTQSQPWVTDDGSKETLTLDKSVTEYLETAKKIYDGEYSNNTSMWDNSWAADMKDDSKVFCYFGCPWFIGSMQGNGATKSEAKRS